MQLWPPRLDISLISIYIERTKNTFTRALVYCALSNIRAFNKIATSTEILWIKADNIGRRRMANGRHKNLFAGPERIIIFIPMLFSFLYRASYLWDLECCASNKTLIGFIIKILLKFHIKDRVQDDGGMIQVGVRKFCRWNTKKKDKWWRRGFNRFRAEGPDWFAFHPF